MSSQPFDIPELNEIYQDLLSCILDKEDWQFQYWSKLKYPENQYNKKRFLKFLVSIYYEWVSHMQMTGRHEEYIHGLKSDCDLD